MALSPILATVNSHVTNNMSFPSSGMQILSSLIHFSGVSILSHCLSRRISIEHLTSLRGLGQLSWPRLCIILVFLDSWLFLFTSGVLIFGAGMELNSTVCNLGVDVCIAFYASSKVLIYCFLMERVYIVWSPATPARRFKTPVYIACFIVLCLFSVIVVVVVIGRLAFFRDDGSCVIGLRKYSSVTLLTYDLFVNIFLTTLFLYPLLRTRFPSPTVRRVAVRTTFAAVMALLTSATNVAILTIMHGRQLGWVCLGSCGTDVIVNALVIFWVTGSSTSKSGGGITQTNGAAPNDNKSPSQTQPVHFLEYQSRRPSSARKSRFVNPPAAAAEPSGHANVTRSGGGQIHSIRSHRASSSGSHSSFPFHFFSDMFGKKRTRPEEHSMQITITREMVSHVDGNEQTEYTIDEDVDAANGEDDVKTRSLPGDTPMAESPAPLFMS
ncbi:hypothetical protein JAAARDRAFT_66874 [Jaapia argillacea MUCL 33604]|uniref:Uncharacterized protein n=1 Tax=Jaapia argillacea MUCL 33604 TaxID=933084 RepID=A0A067Q442_9AGAM|nr:hypothetical protein JAAARDRAFT_66874 [Jaapia argillacea MUCL 33604]